MNTSTEVIADGPGAALHAESYRFLQTFVRNETGIVLKEDKEYLLEARLLPIVREGHLGSLNDLCALLKAAPEHPLKRKVVDAMTTNETFFFRDAAQYEALKKELIPKLAAEIGKSRKLRFWSAASSSGQEAYSLAIMLREMGFAPDQVEILGTDLSSQMLEKAARGRFMQIEVNRGLPAPLLIRYFTRAGLEWQLKDEIRSMVQFRAFDLRRAMTTLGPFDVVFCRNVLIYFDVELKKQILTGIFGTLYRGGYLLLGGSETTLNLENRFERVSVGGAAFYQAA